MAHCGMALRLSVVLPPKVIVDVIGTWSGVTSSLPAMPALRSCVTVPARAPGAKIFSGPNRPDHTPATNALQRSNPASPMPFNGCPKPTTTSPSTYVVVPNEPPQPSPVMNIAGERDAGHEGRLEVAAAGPRRAARHGVEAVARPAGRPPS